MKKFLSIFITLTIVLSAFMVPSSVNAESVIDKKVMQFKNINLSFGKSRSKSYDCKVENNDGLINVSAENMENYFCLIVEGKNPTKSVKPKITITDKANGSVVKTFRFTVTAAKKVNMKDVKLQVKTSKIVGIYNPYMKDYKFKYDKKKLSIKPYTFYYGHYTLKGIKKGTVTVKATISGKVIGSFKVKIDSFKASVKKSSKKQTIIYNKHIKSYQFFSDGAVDIGSTISNIHPNAVYTVKIKNKKVAASRMLKKDEQMPKRAQIYALKAGKTTVDVYEKRGKAKKTKIGTISLTVKKVKDSAVFDSNCNYDNDGIFYENFISPGDKYNLKNAVVSRYINCEASGSHFKESEYSFSFTASPSDIITVDNNGIVTCHSVGSNKVSYTVTFADGSKVKGSGSFDIFPEGEIP